MNTKYLSNEIDEISILIKQELEKEDPSMERVDALINIQGCLLKEYWEAVWQDQKN
jgi:hypothetical protein